jgi:hypothetical protein
MSQGKLVIDLTLEDDDKVPIPIIKEGPQVAYTPADMPVVAPE